MPTLFTPGYGKLLVQADPEALHGKVRVIHVGTRAVDSRPTIGRIRKHGYGLPDEFSDTSWKIVVFVWNNPIEVVIEKEDYLIIDYRDVVLFAD